MRISGSSGSGRRRATSARGGSRAHGAGSRAIGVRLSIRHHDLTFGGTNWGGVRVDFKEPVARWGIHIPALYLTVDDLEGFAAALAERGLSGDDPRPPRRTASAPRSA